MTNGEHKISNNYKNNLTNLEINFFSSDRITPVQIKDQKFFFNFQPDKLKYDIKKPKNDQSKFVSVVLEGKKDLLDTITLKKNGNDLRVDKDMLLVWYSGQNSQGFDEKVYQFTSDNLSMLSLDCSDNHYNFSFENHIKNDPEDNEINLNDLNSNENDLENNEINLNDLNSNENNENSIKMDFINIKNTKKEPLKVETIEKDLIEPIKKIELYLYKNRITPLDQSNMFNEFSPKTTNYSVLLNKEHMSETNYLALKTFTSDPNIKINYYTDGPNDSDCLKDWKEDEKIVCAQLKIDGTTKIHVKAYDPSTNRELKHYTINFGEHGLLKENPLLKKIDNKNYLLSCKEVSDYSININPFRKYKVIKKNSEKTNINNYLLKILNDESENNQSLKLLTFTIKRTITKNDPNNQTVYVFSRKPMLYSKDQLEKENLKLKVINSIPNEFLNEKPVNYVKLDAAIAYSEEIPPNLHIMQPVNSFYALNTQNMPQNIPFQNQNDLSCCYNNYPFQMNLHKPKKRITIKHLVKDLVLVVFFLLICIIIIHKEDYFKLP